MMAKQKALGRTRDELTEPSLLISIVMGGFFKDNFHKISRFPHIREKGILCRQGLTLYF